MDRDEHKVTRRGPAALLALLLSILLSPAGAASALADVGPAAVTQPQSGKSAVIGRAIRRASDDQADPSDPTFDSGGLVPSDESDLQVHRPIWASIPRSADVVADDRPAPFRARAPPAA